MQWLDASVRVEQLLLDPINPRLPEEVQDRPQAEILTYLYENDDLDELMASMAQNAYFASEPLLVLEPQNESNKYVVVEGNRRLGALMILLGLDSASQAGLQPDPEVSESPRLHELQQVPCVLLQSRDEVNDYLGFRHINGLREWAPEAKARYLYKQVEAAVQEGHPDPFYVVGRRVGSNALGVRNAYTSYNLLRYARDELSIRAAARAF